MYTLLTRSLKNARNLDKVNLQLRPASQQTFTSSKSTMETVEKSVKYELLLVFFSDFIVDFEHVLVC